MAINPTFAGFLEEEPRAAFFGTLGQKGLLDTSTRRRHAQQIYSDAMSEFYGKLGEQILGGGQPTLKFTDYMQEQFPYTERLAQMGRQFSPAGTRYSPRTRHLYY